MRVHVRAAGALVVLVAGGTGWADLDVTERKFVRGCLEALGGKSERLRAAAADGLAKMGPEAVPSIVAGADLVKTDEGWTALRNALVRMGTGTADALEKEKPRWPKASAERLAAALASARAGTASSPADVEAKVRAILAQFKDANFYSSDDPRVRQIAALGRAAVPAICAVIEESPGRHSMVVEAAVDALEKLVTPDDVPRLVRMLDAGITDVAEAMAKVPCPAVCDALLASVARGDVEFDVCHALEKFRTDARVVPALCAWVRGPTFDPGFRLAAVAEYLGRSDSDAAADALVAVLPRVDDGQSRWRVGEALVNLGCVEGIELLLAVVEGKQRGSSETSWRRSAARELNSVAGRPIYPDSHEMGPARDDEIDAAVRAAATELREWWNSVKATIRFDDATKRWVQ